MFIVLLLCHVKVQSLVSWPFERRLAGNKDTSAANVLSPCAFIEFSRDARNMGIWGFNECTREPSISLCSPSKTDSVQIG